MTGRWTAHLAPIGVPSPDRRVIDPAAVIGHPAPPMYAYLVTYDDEDNRIRLGVVEEVIMRDGWLIAAGDLFVPDSAARRALALIRDRVLRPEMSLAHIASHLDPGPAGSEGLDRFTRGIVAAIVAGRNPAWPDVRFHLEES